MTEVCEVWTDDELAALILGTVALAIAGELGVILLCLWLAGRPWPAGRCDDTGGAPIGSCPRNTPQEPAPAG